MIQVRESHSRQAHPSGYNRRLFDYDPETRTIHIMNRGEIATVDLEQFHKPQPKEHETK